MRRCELLNRAAHYTGLSTDLPGPRARGVHLGPPFSKIKGFFLPERRVVNNYSKVNTKILRFSAKYFKATIGKTTNEVKFLMNRTKFHPVFVKLCWSRAERRHSCTNDFTHAGRIFYLYIFWGSFRKEYKWKHTNS